MQSFGNGLDRFLGNMIRVCYLLGAVLGSFAFFGHLAVQLPELTWAFGGMVSGALVIHEFLQTRRVLIIGGRWLRGKGSEEEQKKLVSQLKLNLIILGILLAFNAFAMWNYLTLVDTGIQPIPTGIADPLEALALPAFGLVASLLIEVTDDAGVVLERARDAMLFSTTKRAVKQQRNRINRAVENGQNLTPIVTALMVDAGDPEGAHRINLIESGLAATENGGVKSGKSYVPQTRMASALTAIGVHQQNTLAEKGVDGSPKGVQSSSGSGVQKGRKARRPVALTPDRRIYAYLSKNPEASLDEVMVRCKVSRKTAIKWRNQWKYEHSFERTGTEG